MDRDTDNRVSHIRGKQTDIIAKNKGNGNGNGNNLIIEILTRITSLETKVDIELKHLATKAWVLGGVVAGMGLAATITLAIIKLFK